MTITAFVTLAQLKEHLKLPSETVGSPPVALDDADLQQKLNTALEAVCDYIKDKQPADPAWIAEIESWGTGSPMIEAPQRIVLAVKEQAAEYYRFRGDDSMGDRPEHEYGCMTPDIENLLRPFRRPTFA